MISNAKHKIFIKETVVLKQSALALTNRKSRVPMLDIEETEIMEYLAENDGSGFCSGVLLRLQSGFMPI